MFIYSFLKNKFNYIFFLSFFIIKLGASQDYAYKNYSTKDGLVGNHVYHSVQDKEGYLWFATETGVSRFDGQHFVNFTVNEGLPSNEILKLFVDSKGRVWMMPFANQICYYYKGKIYNSINDSLLKRISIKTIVSEIIEDGNRNLIFAEATANLIGLSATNKIYHFNRIKADFYSLGLGSQKQPQIFLSKFSSDYVKLPTELCNIEFNKDSIYLVSTNLKFSFFGDNPSENLISPSLMITTNRANENEVATQLILHSNHHEISRLAKNPGFNNYFVMNDSTILINTKLGTDKFNFINSKKIDEYLGGENVTSCLIDNENNLWFTTANHGIFKMYSNEILNFKWKDKGNYAQTITSVGGDDNDVYVGTILGCFYKLNKAENKILAKKEMTVDFLKGMNQKIKFRQKKMMILDQMTFSVINKGEISRMKIPNDRHFSIKDFDIDKEGRVFIAYHAGACFSDMQPIKNRFQLGNYNYFYNYRTTSVAVGDTVNYLGTLTGLKCFNRNGVIKNILPNLPLLKVSINNLAYSNGLLWIGTNQNGVIGFDGKRIIKNITVEDGLPENSIRCLYICNQKIWVGTNMGIAEISIDNLSDIKVTRTLNEIDGLLSNVTNDLFVSRDTIYAATEDGLSIITKQSKKSNGLCILNDPLIKVGNRFVNSSGIMLNPNEDIQFEYVGISFKSEGDMKYKYRLLGIDSVWKYTNQQQVNFSFLPYGNYNLELIAINKFGIQSRLVSVPFLVKKRFYEENYFRILIVMLTIALIWFLLNKRIQINKNNYLNKLQNAQKIMELEQEALKAQMNPHFIFNCLNAIQHYIIEKDVLSANKFISSFAGLIRQALDNSGRKSITIEEEITFLKSYIEIESNRFEDKFIYEINVGNDIESSLLQIPPMLVQPFVENAINHGLLHKKDGAGKLDIDFSLSEQMLKIIISDNGIGRIASKSFSDHEDLTHVSKGISLTEMRISRLNFSETNKIKLTIKDKYDKNGSASGTNVELMIPLIFNN